MIEIFLRLLPLFFIIFLGKILKDTLLKEPVFWQRIDFLLFYILVPCFLGSRLYAADTVEGVHFYFFCIAGAGLILVFISYILCKFVKISDVVFTSVFQGAVRCNVNIGIPVAIAVLGEKVMLPVTLTTLCLTVFSVPMTVFIMLRFGHSHEKNYFKMIKTMITNPLLIAGVSAITLNVLNVPLHSSLLETLDILSRSAFPLALLAAGAGLTFHGARNYILPICISCVCGLILQPYLTFFIGKYMGLEPFVIQVLAIMTSVPTAATSYIFSRMMGGDPVSMASITFFQTLVLAFTAPFVIWSLPFLL